MGNRKCVIMAGGSGQRFWPVSRPERPKQFLRLADPEKSLLQQAVERAEAIAGAGNFVVQTTPGLVIPSRRELPELSHEQVDSEPIQRNTMGAILWAVARLISQSEDNWRGIEMAVLTADHRIEPLDGFLKTVDDAFVMAREHKAIVTIGIEPSRPDTGFGYIEVGQEVSPGYMVKRFREKPNRDTAVGFLKQGGFLWNSGMFFWTLDTFDRSLEQADQSLHMALHRIVQALRADNHAEAVAIFSEIGNDPVDIALVEHSRSVAVVKAQFDWDDLGTWDSINRSLPSDDSENVGIGRLRAVESNGNVIYNEVDGMRVNLLGVEDMVMVVTEDEILLCPRDRSQDVRRLT